RLRQYRRRAAGRLSPGCPRSLHRRLPAFASLALSRCHRLQPAHRLPAVPATRASEPDPGGQAVSRPAMLLFAALGLGLWALLAFGVPKVLDDYLVRILIVICINAILVVSLGIGNGFTGVFSLGHVGFVAVGAYVSGILSLPLAAKHAYLPDLPGWLGSLTLSFLPATVIAGLICIALAVIVGAPLMRLSGYFVSVAALGAFFAGVGGSLYGHYLGSFSPASFYMAYTFALISMLVIGGMQSLSGAVFGVVLVTVLSEILRNLERGLDFGGFTVPPLYGASPI